MGLMPQIIAQDHPFMGCCYGLGILAAHLGGDVSKARYGEPVGPSTCHLTPEGQQDPLTAGLEPTFDAFVGHKEAVQALPEGCVHLVTSDPCPFQMIRWGQNVYATQFHPEADARDFEQRINIYKKTHTIANQACIEIVVAIITIEQHSLGLSKLRPRQGQKRILQ